MKKMQIDQLTENAYEITLINGLCLGDKYSLDNFKAELLIYIGVDGVNALIALGENVAFVFSYMGFSSFHSDELNTNDLKKLIDTNK
jgi:hypothetical protein